MELWVIDEDGRLCDGHALTDAHDRIEPEFVGPLVEVRTEPHDCRRELGRDLRRTLRTAMSRAEANGKRLVPLGTPLTSASVPAADERGELFETIYGDGVRSAKNCAGTHVHFEKGNVVRQLNLLTALDPALALVSSSPYYLGDRTVDSSRAFAYRTRCGAAFERFCRLWSYVGSVEEWEARVDAAFEAFEELAAEAGVPPGRLRESFSPDDAVLTPVRLRHEQPTVEWRAPDAALPSQVLRLAADVSALVEQTEAKPLDGAVDGVRDDRIGVPDFPGLERLSRDAIRWGLDSGAVREYLAGLQFDVGSYRPISKRISGPGTLRAPEARRLRLEYARRLREDVDALAAARATPTGGRFER